MSRRAMKLALEAVATGTDDCVVWSGYLTPAGRGLHGIRNVGTFLAHRYLYEIVVGPIPDGLQLDHLCYVPACVNPRHLEPVTPVVNTRRAVEHYYGYDPTETCRNGHPNVPENRYGADGKFCKVCNLEACARYRARKRQEATA